VINWKLPAAAAGIAIIISFISGIAGGARFGMIVLRALIGGALFGALSFGINILLRKFLPEIFSIQTEENSQPISNGSVDITIEEENPHENEEEVAESAAAEENDDEEDIPEIAIENDAEIEGEQKKDDDEGEDRDEDKDEDGKRQIENSVSEPVDVTFESQESSNIGDISSKSTVDVLGVEEDPATIVKAVRTFMNKDQ
jgi:hypothetical protein